MLKTTPFHIIHQSSGAKLIDFGGFEMPVQYTSIIKEHQAVRERAGLFDVSHMGEILIEGDEALQMVQHITVNDASKLVPGKVQYSAMCYENGGIADDLLVYMLEENKYMLVVNASNKDKIHSWILRNNEFKVNVRDVTVDTCLLALQGPASIDILQQLTDVNLNDIPYYTFKTGTVAGVPDVIISATGYTGEKGFELYFSQSKNVAPAFWEALIKVGSAHGLEPCGLGARDTLRLEMGFALYGNDISEDTTPLEAGLGWVTKLEKGDFIGRSVLVGQKTNGISKKLIGFVTAEPRSIPRSHYLIKNESGETIGEVTSGGQSINLGTGIGMGYVHPRYASEGSEIFIEIRGKLCEAMVTKPPFIKKK